MTNIDYIGLDVHKRSISFCAKAQDGRIVEEGTIAARRASLLSWAKGRPRPWVGALEATLFTGWIYDYLKPLAQEIKVAHPAMLKAIAASKKKNDKVDARKIADLLRCDLLPECYMAPSPIRELRRVLRYRNLVVRQATRMKNRIAGLLLETGTPYNTQRLHGKAYFSELLDSLEETPASVRELLRLSRSQLDFFTLIQKYLLKGLRQNTELRERVQRLESIPAVGPVLALTWTLEIGEVQRFSSIAQAISYCGLTSAQRNSAGKEQRGPISKQRNKHLQTILIEAAKLAPRHSPQLAAVHEQELARGNRNRATLAIARKLVAYLMAVDRSGKSFQLRDPVSQSSELTSGKLACVPAPPPVVTGAEARTVLAGKGSLRRPKVRPGPLRAVPASAPPATGGSGGKHTQPPASPTRGGL
jgi:transposase